MWSSEPRKLLAIYRTEVVPSFLSYFKTLSIGLIPGIEPMTCSSAVKCSTDWASPAKVMFVMEFIEGNHDFQMEFYPVA